MFSLIVPGEGDENGRSIFVDIYIRKSILDGGGKEGLCGVSPGRKASQMNNVVGGSGEG